MRNVSSTLSQSPSIARLILTWNWLQTFSVSNQCILLTFSNETARLGANFAGCSEWNKIWIFYEQNVVNKCSKDHCDVCIVSTVCWIPVPVYNWLQCYTFINAVTSECYNALRRCVVNWECWLLSFNYFILQPTDGCALFSSLHLAYSVPICWYWMPLKFVSGHARALRQQL